MSSPIGEKLLVGGIRVSPDASMEEIIDRAKTKMKRAGIATDTLHFRLYKKSVDARRRDDVTFVCTVMADGELRNGRISQAKLQKAAWLLMLYALHGRLLGIEVHHLLFDPLLFISLFDL